MNKTISRMSAAIFAAAMLAVCSCSDDVVNNNATPEQPTAKGEVVLSGTLGSKGMTRSVDADGNATWTVGDKFAIYYPTSSGHSTADATISSLNDNGSANFRATLYYPVAGTVNLVYPASQHDGQGGYKTTGIGEQDGTIDGINSRSLDIQTGTASLTVENTDGQTVKATLNSDVQLAPQLCIYTFSLKKDANTNLGATKLEITAGSDSYTVTPYSATNSFTVALKPIGNSSFTFAATTTESGHVYTKQDVTLATCTAANVGQVFDKDGNVYSVSNGPGVIYGKSFSGKTLEAGKMYSSNLTLEPGGGITPVAMIAYVGAAGTADTSTGAENYRGLAMAMQDAGSYAWGSNSYDPCTVRYYPYATFNALRFSLSGISWTTWLVAGSCGHSNHNAAKAAKNYSVDGFTPNNLGCSGWFLPAFGQWVKFFEACGVNVSGWSDFGNSPGGVSDCAIVRNTMNNAGADCSIPASMWTSSEIYGGYGTGYAMRVTFMGSGLSGGSSQKNVSLGVRPFLAF